MQASYEILCRPYQSPREESLSNNIPWFHREGLWVERNLSRLLLWMLRRPTTCSEIRRRRGALRSDWMG